MEKIKEIIVLGTGGNAVDIADTIEEINTVLGNIIYKCIGFLDDDLSKIGKRYLGVEVLGTISSAHKYNNAFFINGIGNDKTYVRKQEIISKTKIPLGRFITLVHPSASVSKTAKIGFGSIIFQNVTVASNAKIGNHVMIMPNSIISHDDIVGDYTTITGGVCISGKVRIGKSVYMGTNSSVNGYISIGDNSLVGMGCVVVKTVAKNSVVVGNPARFIRKVIAPKLQK